MYYQSCLYFCRPFAHFMYSFIYCNQNWLRDEMVKNLYSVLFLFFHLALPEPEMAFQSIQSPGRLINLKQNHLSLQRGNHMFLLQYAARRIIIVCWSFSFHFEYTCEAMNHFVVHTCSRLMAHQSRTRLFILWADLNQKIPI